MRKLRKDARCQRCKRLLIESALQDRKDITCECGWERPTPDDRWFNKLNNLGRPRRENPLGLTPYDIATRDNDAPAWFHEAMMFQEKWITVQQFAERFGAHATQVRRWCELGFIHCAWTDHTYYKKKNDGKGKGNVKWKHYAFNRPEGKGNTHRRIPESEVERCHFLKFRQHSVRPIAGRPEKPSWRSGEPRSVSIPKKQSEPGLRSNPSEWSEPRTPSKPLSGSEPEARRKPVGESEPIDIRKPINVSEPEPMSKPIASELEIDLSVFEE